MGTTLTGKVISATYDALLKVTDNDAITSTAKRITDGLGNDTPLYISTTRIGIGVSPTTTFHVSGNSQIGGNLTVTGDLLVEGSTTTIDTETLSVEDPLIIVGSNNTTSDAVDLGIYGVYDTSGSQNLYAGIFRRAADNKFHIFRDLQTEPTTTVNLSGTGYTRASLVLGTLEFESLKDLGESITITKFVDQADGISSNDNDTTIPTSAAVKDYVDNNSSNTLAEVLVEGDTTGGGNIVFGDSDVFLADDTLMFGASNDLVIYHDGSNSFIREKGTGNLYIDGETSISLRKYTGAENMLVANTDGSVELYYDDSKKLETTSTGVTVTGTIISDGLDLGDSEKIRLGDSQDLEIYHNGTSSYIYNNTGVLNIVNEALNDIVFADSLNDRLIIKSTGEVELNYAGDKKLETTSGGITVTGTSIHTGIEIESTSPQILFDETDVTANWRNRVSGGSWRVQYASDGSTFSDQFVVGASNINFETDATFAGDVTVNGGDIILGGTGRIQGIDTVSASTDAASKGYVDSIVTAQDLDFEGDSGTGAVDLDSQTFTIAGTANEIETSASSQTLTIGLPNDVTIGNDLTVTNDLYIPSYIYHTGDTNTFFGFSGNDTIIFRTAGSTRLEIASDGHIGINESDPDTILHISDGNTGDPSTNAPVIRLQNTSVNCSNLFTDGDVIGGLEFYNDEIFCTDIGYPDGVTAYFRAVHDGSNSPTPTSSLEFGTGTLGSSSTRMTIDSSGNVAINEFLRVGGNVNNANTFTYTLQSRGLLVAGDSGTSESNLYLHRDDVTISAGNVIGNLHFSGQDGASNIGAQIRAEAAASWSATSAPSNIIFSNCTSGSNTLTPRMVIDSSGRVGIGISSPNDPFHLAMTNGAIRIDAETNRNHILSRNSNDSAWRDLAISAMSGQKQLVLTTGGRVGIKNTSPSTTLDVAGGVRGDFINPSITASSGTSSNQNVYKLGRLTLSNSNGCIIKVLGTVSYSSGANTSGVTYIFLRGNNSTSLLDGHFYGHTQGQNTIASVRYVNISSNVFDIYVKYNGTFSALDTVVEGGVFDPDLTNTGSTSFPTSVSLPSIFSVTTSGAERMRIHSDGIIDLGDCAQVVPSSVTSFIRFVPAADTTVDLGAGSKRWEEVFSVQSSINTSDENEKQQIENLDEVELRVAQRIKGLIRKFKWNSAVENKGDNARIHFGVIAQDLQRAFEAEGLDAEKYGLFCSDTWWEEEVTETDEEGNEKTTIKTYEEYKEGTIEKTRLGVRYTELLAFVIAAL